MNTNSKLLLIAVVSVILLAGCTGQPQEEGDMGGNGTVTFIVSGNFNDAEQEFDTLNITFLGAYINESQRRESVRFDQKKIDISDLQGGKAAVIGKKEVRPGTYDSTSIFLQSASGMNNGEDIDFLLPEARLSISKTYKVESGENTFFLVDVFPSKIEGTNLFTLIPVTSSSGEVSLSDVDLER